jgi:hypothetical protein
MSSNAANEIFLNTSPISPAIRDGFYRLWKDPPPGTINKSNTWEPPATARFTCGFKIFCIV